MKKHIFLAAFAALFILSYLYVNDTNQHEKMTTQLISKPSSKKTINQLSSDDPKELYFEYNVSTQVIDENKKILSDSVFKGKIALKKWPEKNHWFGQALEANILQQGNIKKLSPKILFTTEYNNFVFTKTNFLGLDKSHPAHSIVHLFSQLSYQPNQALTIANATGSTSYRYHIKDNLVKRVVHTRNQKQLSSDLAITDIDESWLLALENNNFPENLNSAVTTTYKNQTSQFIVKQVINISAIDIKSTWELADYTNNANSKLAFQTAKLNAVMEINSSVSLNKALAKLANFPDDLLAKAIGKYLIENYSADDIAKLLEQQKDSDVASLIIYSIQKNPTFAAEVILVELLTHPEVEIANKHRLIMSLGRFEAVSDLSLNQLKVITEKNNSELANTAKLSIGTVAKYNQEQQEKVKQFLSQQLNETENKAVTLLAINNSGLSELNHQAITLLGDKSANVNVALIKLLANDPMYHDDIYNFAINSNQAKSINEFSRALTANKLVLTNAQKKEITEKITKTDNPLIKEQLAALLTVSKKQW
ncbi:MAG: hypothetical protein GY787_27170 [Alteromonadales bacterium]|nr:hypothetical protein [Alteromonadales bacterium]